MRHLTLLLIAVMTVICGASLLLVDVELKSVYAQPQAEDADGELEELGEAEQPRAATRSSQKSSVAGQKTSQKKSVRQSKAERAKNQRLKVTQVQTRKRRGNASSSEVYLQQIQRIESQVNHN